MKANEMEFFEEEEVVNFVKGSREVQEWEYRIVSIGFRH